MTTSANFRDRFLAQLLAMRPASVLDVGCGDGALLRQLAGSVTRLTGVDIVDERIRAARANAVDAQRADALHLPFANDEFDFVVGQYTAHHVTDATRATAEALRVARVGVMALDVWYDASMPAQRTALRFDAWSKRIDEDNGEIHRPVQSLTVIAGPWLGLPDVRVAVEYWQSGARLPLDEIEFYANSQLARSRNFERDQREWHALRAEGLGTGFGEEGAILVTILKR